MRVAKNVIAVLFVVCFLGSIMTISGFILFGLVDPASGLELLKNVSATMSGFVGIIAGHYFSSSSPSE